MHVKPTKILILSLFYLFTSKLTAQDIPTFTQFFTNPYMYNPAYAGLEGRSTFVLTHHRQWIGINDAPVTTNFLYHTALKFGVNLGANITQDEFGIFKTTSGLLTFGYTVSLGWNHFISFGISGGSAFNNLDLSEGVNLNDPALAGVLENSISLAGNAGIAYHISNFNIGFALPNLFKTATYSTIDFDKGEFDALTNFNVTADYMIYFADGQNALEPYFLYRSYQGIPSQFEGGAIFHYKEVFWLGGGYRQDFGYMGMLGLKLNYGLSIGYAFEYSATSISGINLTSHEIQISFLLGDPIPRKENYATFLDNTMRIRPIKVKKEEPKKENRPRFEHEFDD